MPKVSDMKTGLRGPHSIDPPTIRQLFEMMEAIRDSLVDFKAIFDAHKHGFDGTGTTNQISNVPITGTSSGTSSPTPATTFTNNVS